MATRIYLKERPADVEGMAPLKLTQDVYGYYYEMTCGLELLELPPAIKPDNIRQVSILQDVHPQYSYRNGGSSRREYRLGSCTALQYDRDSCTWLNIVSPDLKNALDFCRLFKQGLVSQYAVDVPQKVTSRTGNRFSRALRVLIGNE